MQFDWSLLLLYLQVVLSLFFVITQYLFYGLFYCHTFNFILGNECKLLSTFFLLSLQIVVVCLHYVRRPSVRLFKILQFLTSYLDPLKLAKFNQSWYIASLLEGNLNYCHKRHTDLDGHLRTIALR